jgi:hypothetical protein
VGILWELNVNQGSLVITSVNETLQLLQMSHGAVKPNQTQDRVTRDYLWLNIFGEDFKVCVKNTVIPP